VKWACSSPASDALPDRRRGGSAPLAPMARHDFPAVVALGQVGVVGATHQPDVRHAVVTPKAERVPMVEFESVALLAPSSLFVYVAAAVSVALTHGTPDPRGDVARGRHGACIFCLRGALAASLGVSEATGLEPFELLGDGLLDDRGQISVSPFEPISALSRSSLWWNSAVAVNCSLYRPGDRGWTTGGDTGEAGAATAGAATPSGRSSKTGGVLLSGSLRTTTGTSGWGEISAICSSI
jgi:hypothetical protein